MMASTHLLAGMAIAAITLPISPEVSTIAVVAAALGGVFPDLDLYVGHRKTLHFPVYYSVAAVGGGVAAALTGQVALVAVTFFLGAAALHSAMDAFGGGLELRPWLGRSRRAVYSHYHGRWIEPRRWVRFDGAPEDLLLASGLGGVAMLAFGSPVDEVVVAVLGVSAFYALVRKPLVELAERVVARLPREVLGYVPNRFVEDVVEA